MPHIKTSSVPGIRAGFELRPKVAQAASLLAQATLREAKVLLPVECEVLAALTSKANDCHY